MPTTTGDTVVIVRQLTGAPLSLTLSPSSTVAQLKKMVERKNSVAADSQRIVFSGRELENARALSYYGMAAGAEHQATLVLKTKGMRVLVKTLKECTFTIDCDATSTVLEMKHKVAEQDAQWHVQRQRIILHGKELDDEKRLSDCGLDDETPTVHVVMRLPAPGTARKRRDPVLTQKGVEASQAAALKTPSTRANSAMKVKAEPAEDEAMSNFSGLNRQLSDMIVDGDQMEFDSAWQEYEDQSGMAGMAGMAPAFDIEAGFGPRTPKKAQVPAMSSEDAKIMESADVAVLDRAVSSFLAPGTVCPAGPESSSPSPKASFLESQAILSGQVEAETGLPSSPLVAQGSAAVASPSVSAKPQPAVDIDGDESDAGAPPSTQGRAYDLTKVDEKLRKRLLKNRLSAERSRQRKQAHVEQLEYQLSCSRSENEFLKKRVATLEAQVASLSLQPVCKPDTFRHRDPVACEA